MITYAIGSDGIAEDMLSGFFVGWPSPPTEATLLATLRASSHVVTARQDGRVVGFINALSDGVLSAFIPLLEVRPECQGQGIGSELLRRMLLLLGPLYCVDLVCDADVAPFYDRFSPQRVTGIAWRNYDAPAIQGPPK